MAKTKGASVGRQAPSGAWSPNALVIDLKKGSVDEKVEVLRLAGILDANNKLATKYKNWGKKVTRTQGEGSEGAE